MYFARHKHLVSKICHSDWSLVVIELFKGKMGGCIGFVRSKSIEKDLSI